MPVASSFVKASAVVAIIFAGTVSARAAAVTPLSSEACATLAKQVSDAIRLPVKTSEGDPRTVRDDAPAGRACLLTAGGTGLAQTFAQAESRLAKVMDGWSPIPEMAADGPDSTSAGYAKDSRQVLVMLERAPPAGTCADVVQADCRQPAKRWRWTFKAAAYMK